MFHERLKKLRENEKITREHLASSLGITYSALSKYETGKREPDFELLQKIANYFKVTTDYLLCVSDEPSPVNHKLAGISDEDYNKLSAYQKEVIDFFLTRENLFFKNQPENMLDALEQFEVFYEVWKKQQENKK
ncbi:helix-turn-helix domain-containing protein [Lysinibacillus xylanilyticus]|uniref:helix-turn-helix domain-containing protein n=1 Tax=Lysinibacillus xylanilyticus TaxID=582475 RepID=UPI00083C9A38|nr:helix-turn-helix transcriptional regulator [Lysinibacillus xylanilyticus]